MLTTEMLFDNWSSLARTVIIGAAAYVALLLMLRISGNRTLAKMNSFDLVVTVALGSTLATVLLNKDVALAEGVVAFALLLALQWLVAWSLAHFAWIRGIVRSEPQLLVYRSELMRDAMRRQRVTQQEIMQATRSQGILSLDQIEGLVLEPNGTFSVVERRETSGPSSLADLSGQVPPDRRRDT